MGKLPAQRRIDGSLGKTPADRSSDHFVLIDTEDHFESAACRPLDLAEPQSRRCAVAIDLHNARMGKQHQKLAFDLDETFEALAQLDRKSTRMNSSH